MRDLAERVWIGNIDDPQALGKPCAGNFRAGDLLARLVTSGHERLRLALDTVDLEATNRYRALLVSDVDHPDERRHRFYGPLYVLVRDQHVTATADVEWDRQRRMCRARKRRRPIEARYQLRLRDVVDVEDDESAEPITGVESAAEP